MRDIDTLTRSLERTEKRLEAALSAVARHDAEKKELQAKVRDMERHGRMYAKEYWYVTYLQKEMFRIERQYDELQDNFHLMVKDNRQKQAFIESIHVL